MSNVIAVPFGPKALCEGDTLANVLAKGWIVPFWRYGKADSVKVLPVAKVGPEPINTILRTFMPVWPEPVSRKTVHERLRGEEYVALVAHDGGPVLSYVPVNTTDEEIRSFYQELDEILTEQGYFAEEPKPEEPEVL